MFLVKDKSNFRLEFAILYILSQLKFLHGFLPKDIRDRLPLGWSFKMFWLTFISNGKKMYSDYFAELREPRSYQPKVEVAEPYRFSEEEIRSFYEKGYIGPFRLMSPQEAAEFKDHAIAVASSPSEIYSYENGDFGLKFKEEVTSTGNVKVKSNREVAMEKMNWRDRHLEDERILNLFTNAGVTERCAQLLGPDLMLWRTQFFPKAKSNCGTPWHQATTYLFDNMRESVVSPPDPTELFQLTVWIALTDTTEDRSPMAVVRGTHKQVYIMTGGKEYKADPNAEREKNRLGTMQVAIDCEINEDNVDRIEMQAGEFFIFSERVVHGSFDNLKDEWRWAINGRVVRPDTKVYSDTMLNEGHSYRTQNVVNLKLDKWKGIMIRGVDRFKHNRT